MGINERPGIFALSAVIFMALTALAGCATGDATAVARESARSSAPAVTLPSPSPSIAPPDSLPNIPVTLPTDCKLDTAAAGVVTFIVTADDNSTPIDLAYTVFQQDREPEIRTATSKGPSVVVLQSNCGSTTSASPWTFKATSLTGGSLGCATFYGGKLLASTSTFSEGEAGSETSVDCSAHPGT